MRIVLRAFVAMLFLSSVHGIIPKDGDALKLHEDSAEHMHNIGELFLLGNQKKSCTATLVGRQGNVGVVLTAGHCLDVDDQAVLSKCSNVTVSFSAENPSSGEALFPVLGRYALSEYIDLSRDYEFDLGVVFIDMSNSSADIAEHPFISSGLQVLETLGVVHVVGYGKTSLFDNLDVSKRRAMSTHGVYQEKNGHVLIAMDESPIEGRVDLVVPVGDSAAEGDSGGPIINAKTGEIIGVVSHKNGDVFYSEPLVNHVDWLHRQVQILESQFVFHPNLVSRLSDKHSWKDGRLPFRFRTPYGEVSPVLSISAKQQVVLDADIDLHAVNFNKEGGSLVVAKGNRFVESLNIKASTNISSREGGELTVDCMNVESSALSIKAPLRILTELNINAKLDTKKQLRLLDSGSIYVSEELGLRGVVFEKPVLEKNKYDKGVFTLDNTTVESQSAIEQSCHILRVLGSSKIKADYLLTDTAELRFVFSDSLQTPLLAIDGRAKLKGGVIMLEGSNVLPFGFEATILKTRSLELGQGWRWFYDTNLVSPHHEIAFIRKDGELKIKVVPALAFEHEEEKKFSLDKVV